jgi:hypothetical protein
VKLVNTTRSRVHQKISSARAAPIIGLAAFSIIAAVVTLPAQADQTAAMAAAPAKNPNGGDPRSARSRLHRFRRERSPFVPSEAWRENGTAVSPRAFICCRQKPRANLGARSKEVAVARSDGHASRPGECNVRL